MAIGLTFRPKDRAEGQARQGCFGLAFLAFGSLLVWAGYHLQGWDSPVLLIGAVLDAMGLWVLLGRLAFPRVDPLRVLGGVLCAALGLGCLAGGVFFVLTGAWQGLGLLPFGALWLLGAAMVFNVQHRLLRRWLPEDARDKAIGGGVAITCGMIIVPMIIANPSGMSEGVPLFVGVAAGGAFFLAGVLLIGDATRLMPSGGILYNVVVALLVTDFGLVSFVFPPSALFVAVIAVQVWVGVYRKIHEKVTGRDPLGALSQAKQFGVGCLVALVLALVIVLLAWLNRPTPPPENLPLEAPPSMNSPSP